MPTAALAQVRFPVDRWAEIARTAPGELVRVWRVKRDP
jgi:hypothetical protein